MARGRLEKERPTSPKMWHSRQFVTKKLLTHTQSKNNKILDRYRYRPKPYSSRAMFTYLSNQSQAVLGQSISCIRSAHCGRAAGPLAAARILRRLNRDWREPDTAPPAVTVVIAAGRDALK